MKTRSFFTLPLTLSMVTCLTAACAQTFKSKMVTQPPSPSPETEVSLKKIGAFLHQHLTK